LLAVLGGLAFAAHLMDATGALRRTSLPKTPEVLVERARDVVMRLGYGEPPADWAYSLELDRSYFERAMRSDPSSTGSGDAAFPPFSFYYRQSPRRLIAANRDGLVSRDDPPLDVSGMVEVVLDPSGRLTSFLAVPPQVEAAARPWPEPDWAPLFRESGLDPAAFRPADPQWAAPVDSDRKASWEGSHPLQPATNLRIEAAAYHGRPVWFVVLPPWAKATRMLDSVRPSSPIPVGDTGVWILALAMPVGGVLLARRNLRLGRGDRNAAFRVALFVFASYSIARLFRSDHVSVFGSELWILIKAFAYPAFWAAQVWLLYMALEPYVRRRWPHVLISWKRLLTGNLRDPLVGRDVLLGTVAGTVLVVMLLLSMLAPVRLGLPPLTPQNLLDGSTLTELRHGGFRLFVNQFSAVLYALVFLFMLVLLRVILRNQWLAMAIWCVLVGGPLVGENPALEWFFGLGRAVVMLLVLTRGGLLPLTVALFFMFSAFEVPLTLDITAWYATRGLPVVLFLVGLALYGFHTSLARKPLFGRSLLED
jgi:serine/threonine-protein kinase